MPTQTKVTKPSSTHGNSPMSKQLSIYLTSTNEAQLKRLQTYLNDEENLPALSQSCQFVFSQVNQ